MSATTTSRPADTATAPAAFRGNGLFNIVAAIGVLLQYLVGVPGYPTVPPGPIILGVVGILVLVLAARLRWIIVLGLLAPAFVTVGGIVQGGSFARMGSLANVGFFASTWIQWVGMVLAIAYGVIGVVSLIRRTS